MKTSRASRRAAGGATRWVGVGGALAALALSVGALAPGCTALVPSTAQCTKDADCVKIAPGATCDTKASICVGGDQCQKNADCAGKGQHPVCRQLSPRKCVDLTNPDCPDLFGQWDDDNAVIFGLITPRDASDLSTGESIQNGAHLAVDQINTVKLPPKPGATAPRPIAVVACNDQADNMTAVRAAQHLVNDVGIQAINGAAFSGITIDVAQQVTIPAGVLLMSPSATSNVLTDLADEDPACIAACGSDQACKNNCPELLWRTSPPDSIQGAAIIRYFKSGFEAEVKSHLMKTTLKIAVAYKGDAYGTGLKSVVEKGLVFNGMPALAQQGGNYVPLDYGNPDNATTDPIKYDTTVTKLVQAQPDVILVFGTNEGVVPNSKDPGSGIMDRVEKGWTGATKPYWLFSDGGVIPELVTVARANGASGRTRATAPGTNNQNFQLFESAYSGAFAGDPSGSAQVFGAAGSYDIVYLFSYAAVAAKGAPLTGDNLARGLGQTVGGTPIAAGTDRINDAFNTLSSGASINYDGASGPLDFDLATGEAVSDIILWCIPQSATNDNPIPSGQIYSGASDSITGLFSSSMCSP